MAAVGFNCKMTEGATPITLGKAIDVDLTVDGKEIDITTRSSAGWKEFVQGLKEATISIDELWLPTDQAYIDLLAAFNAGTVLAFTMVDAAASGKGFSGNMIIVGHGMKQPLNGALTIPIKAKVTGALTTV